MTDVDPAWIIVTYAFVAGIASLCVWLHWSDSIYSRTARNRRTRRDGVSIWTASRDRALRRHISATVVAVVWPVCLPIFVALGIRWLYRWLRFAAGGEYPG